uniref:Cilia- and flagella-associated protein 57 n=1 Tax=Chlamydomonas euryale TaxID=1486919 RepID=A0A7R9VL67_9CHLO|mmetsp:Transcript_38637/g.114745  ORF Transcript_38637/g.114745 Transcript_38637/m.114745 type:complete len:1410 (+) Transcript_38637:132-4361(+)
MRPCHGCCSGGGGGGVLSAVFCPTDKTLAASATAGGAALHRVDAEMGSISVLPVDRPADVSGVGGGSGGPLGSNTALCWLAGGLLALTTSLGRVVVNQDKDVKCVVNAADDDYLTTVAPRARGFVAAGAAGRLYVFDPVDAQAKKAGSRGAFALMRVLPIRVHAAGAPSVVPHPATTAACRASLASTAGSEMLSTLGGGVGGAAADATDEACEAADGMAYLPRAAALQVSSSAGDDTVAVLTAGGDVATVEVLVALNEADGDGSEEQGREEGDLRPWQLLAGGSGRARLVGMDAASAQPLLLTAGEDRMVRLVHYEAQRCIVARRMEDEVLCCALHPSGSQLLVGLHSELRLYSVALDELILRAAFTVKRCNAVVYSNGGGMFAAVGRTNTVVVHHAYNLHQVCVLKGHVSAVTSLCFSADDRVLVSTGAGGAVYFWDLVNGTRIIDQEFVDKRSIYCSAAQLARPGSGAIVRSRDGRLQHVRAGRVVHEVAGPPGGLASPITLLGDDAVVLAAAAQGCVLAYAWPAAASAGTDVATPPPSGYPQPPPQTIRLHAESALGLAGMVVLQDRGLMVTAGTDGTIVISSIALVRNGQLMEGTLVGVGRAATATGAATGGGNAPLYVTVNEDRLMWLHEKQRELTAVVAATKASADYQVFRQTQALRDVMSKLQDENTRLATSLADARADAERLRGGVESAEQRVVRQLEASHMTAAEELEGLYEQRLQLEHAKLVKMAAAMDDLQFRMEEQLARQRDAHQLEVQQVVARYEARLEEAEALLRSVKSEAQLFEVFHTEYAEQTEADLDEQTDRLEERAVAAAKVAEAREGRLKADNNLLKRTCLRLKGDKAIEAKKMERLVSDNNVLRDALNDQQITIGKLRNELEERDEVMGDNYATIQMLRRQGQDLEKHKFVLGHKAEAYQARLVPKQQEAERLAAELAAHDKELVSELQRNGELKRSLVERESAVRSLKNEIADVKMRMRHQGEQLRLFSVDLMQTWNESDAAERNRLLKQMYTKYCVRNTIPQAADEVGAELNRHLAMAELRSATLEYRLQEAANAATTTRRADLAENAVLLRELQVIQQNHRETSRRLEETQAEMRDLATRYKILDARSRGGGVFAHSGGTHDPLPAAPPATGGDGAGVSSMAGRVVPSRPGSAYPVNGDPSGGTCGGARPGGSSSPAAVGSRPGWMQGSAGSRPTSACASSPAGTRPSSAAAATAPPPLPQRAAGGAAPGNVARGSPARVLHELIGVERERVAALMGQMAVASADLERQRAALATTSNTLLSATVAEEDELGDEGSGRFGDGRDAAQGGTAGTGGAVAVAANNDLFDAHERDAAWAVKRHGPSNLRPGTAGTQRPMSAAAKHHQQQQQGPIAFGTAPRRRPTSAAGIGVRAFINGNVKKWQKDGPQ